MESMLIEHKANDPRGLKVDYPEFLQRPTSIIENRFHHPLTIMTMADMMPVSPCG